MDALAARLQADWSEDCLVLLLSTDDPEVQEVAAVCLGLIGNMSACPALVSLLSGSNDALVETAEDSLWSIWFRQGGAMAQRVLFRISESIREGQTENVLPLLTELIRAAPRYAEAFHQRSQVHYLENDYDRSLRDAVRAFSLNPFHFAALSVQAHCHAALGRYQEALRAYWGVARLHPRLPGVQTSIQQIRERLLPFSDFSDEPALA